jgi:predicted O-methyltransferase YrrM
MKPLDNRNEFARVIIDRDYRIVAEIGVALGGYANVLLRDSPGIKKYVCIDPFNGVHQACPASVPIENLAKYGSKVEFVQKESSAAAGQFQDGYFDFVYIDGNHDYEFVRQDLALYWPKIRVGGMIAGHDYHFSQKGVIKAVDEFVAKHGLKLQTTGLIGDDWPASGMEFTVPSWFIEKQK